MPHPIANLVQQRDAIRALFAEVRSLKNRAARERRADYDANVLNAMTRVKLDKADKELANRLRFRVRVAGDERPLLGSRTARKLYHRGEVIERSLVNSTAPKKLNYVQSLYVQWTSRGLKSGAGRSWRPGEAANFARYILREDALERGEHGWFSNIGADRSEVVAFWRTVPS